MKKMYINGKFTNGHSKETTQVINPATEEVLEEVPQGTQQDTLDAIAAAKSAGRSVTAFLSKGIANSFRAS